jgi:hypothetical protein
MRLFASGATSRARPDRWPGYHEDTEVFVNKTYRYCWGLLVILLTLGCVSGASAAPPGLPATFYGSVRIQGGSVPAGASVRAYIDGIALDQAVVQDDAQEGAVYLLSVRADDPDTPALDGGRNGDVVTFRLELPGGTTYAMVQQGIWQAGASTPLDLSSYVSLTLPLVVWR